MRPKGIYIALPTQPNSSLDRKHPGGIFPNGDETLPNDGWDVGSGTSTAAPMVAGVCALMMQADPMLCGNPNAVRAILIKSCIDVTTGVSASGQAAGIGVDNATGAGLVQAYRAIQATQIGLA
jgi:subtilisin family serine protease